VAAVALGDVRLVGQVRRAGRRWPAPRTWCFGSGLAVAGAVVVAPLDGRFSGHVVEHLVLVMIAPLLVAAGRPLALALVALPGRPRRRLAALLRSPPARLALHPALVWLTAIVAPLVVWFSPLYRWSLDHAAVHGLVHGHLFVAGLLFAAVVMGLDHAGRPPAHPARALAVGLLLPLHALVGMVVLSLERPKLNPGLDEAAGLADQRLGAALMWLGGDLLATVAVAVVVGRWLAAERRRAVVVDAAEVLAVTPGGAAPTRP
jgi:cytochrome c oxidase assembly factor CtaG